MGTRPEAVARLHGLWLARGDLTGLGSPPTGRAMWHRDYLFPTMTALRDPQGLFGPPPPSPPPSPA
ncbi:DUF4913 domain-containing protein [Streptomyces sp. enrichment culture]|uniref:DUF4913 domain-containing protein n=1 Tax=Streptomyces sp. enrichment culture TaxID=1795815 RepID=UPI003F55D149